MKRERDSCDKRINRSKSTEKIVIDVLRSSFNRQEQSAETVEGPELTRSGSLTPEQERRLLLLFRETVGVQDTSSSRHSKRYHPYKREEVSSQKLGAQRTDHPDESRSEASSLPDNQRSQATLPQDIEKIQEEHISPTKQFSQKELPWLEAADKPDQLTYILGKAKPELPPGAKPLLDQLKKVERDIQRGWGNPLSDQEYIQLMKSTLQIMSPETMKAYENYNVKFSCCEGEKDITWNFDKDDKNKRQVNLFTGNKKPLHVLLCLIDHLLQKWGVKPLRFNQGI
jgi:hypothetical protein